MIIIELLGVGLGIEVGDIDGVAGNDGVI